MHSINEREKTQAQKRKLHIRLCKRDSYTFAYARRKPVDIWIMFFPTKPAFLTFFPDPSARDSEEGVTARDCSAASFHLVHLLRASVRSNQYTISSLVCNVFMI